MQPHKMSIGHLHELTTPSPADVVNGSIEITKMSTDTHKGDVFTKEMDVARYRQCLTLIDVASNPEQPASASQK